MSLVIRITYSEGHFHTGLTTEYVYIFILDCMPLVALKPLAESKMHHCDMLRKLCWDTRGCWELGVQQGAAVHDERARRQDRPIHPDADLMQSAITERLLNSKCEFNLCICEHIVMT